MKLYLDGCSFTYGLGLLRKQSLGQLFKDRGGYDVVDCSRNGKSNMAIAMDAYKNADSVDVIVLGFTFSGRFYIKYQEQHIDFQPIRYQLPLADNINSQELGDAYLDFHKYFYTLYQTPFCDDYSDFLIDSVCSYLEAQGKIVLAFSWEQRKTKHQLVYPYIGPNMRLPDRHLNALGTEYLYNILQTQLADKM